MRKFLLSRDANITIAIVGVFVVLSVFASALFTNINTTQRIAKLAEANVGEVKSQTEEIQSDIASLTRFVRCALLIPPAQRTQELLNACITGQTEPGDFEPTEPPRVPTRQAPRTTTPPTSSPTSPPTAPPTPNEPTAPPPTDSPTPTDEPPLICLEGTTICLAEEASDNVQEV